MTAPIFLDTIEYKGSPYHLYTIDGRFTVCYASGAICKNEDTFAEVQSEYLHKLHG